MVVVSASLRETSSRAAIALGVVCLLLLLPAAACAAPGSIDRSFGTGGFVDLSQAPAERFPSLAAFAIDIAPGPEATVLALSVGNECAAECSRPLIVTRYRSDGSVDRGYGDGGSTLLTLGDASGATGASLAVDSNGRATIAAGNGHSVDVARLGPGGGRDRSFGGEGETSVAGGSTYAAHHLYVTPRGKAVIESDWTLPRSAKDAGPGGSTAGLSIARLRPNGGPDRTFGGSGGIRVNLPRSFPPQAVAVRDGGAVVLAGSPCCPSSVQLPYVMKIRADGSVDRRFGPLGGLPRLRRAQSIRVGAVLIRSSGKIDVAGAASWDKPLPAGRDGGFLIGLHGNGRPDRRFGQDGLRLPEWPLDAAALDPQGRIFGAAASEIAVSTPDTQLTAFRLAADGSIDRSFGGGKGVHVAGASGGEGRLVAAYSGTRPVVFNERFFICRTSCPPAPVLVRFAGGPGATRVR